VFGVDVPETFEKIRHLSEFGLSMVRDIADSLVYGLIWVFAAAIFFAAAVFFVIAVGR
jgi:hypothetical protein